MYPLPGPARAGHRGTGRDNYIIINSYNLSAIIVTCAVFNSNMQTDIIGTR